MKPRRTIESILVTLLLFLGFMGTALAQDPDTPNTNISYPSTTQGQAAPGQTNTDPPGRVARIQYMNGEVSIQPGGVNDWVAASMNRPLTTSDRVWTDKNSKAELNVGGAFIRLNSETSVTLTNVSDNTIQVQLDQGVLELTVNYLGGGQIYEVDTPNIAFTVMKPGVYRINAYPNEDQTWVTVRKGQGEATGRGSAVKVKSGEQVRFSGGTSLAHTSEPAPAPDGFDDWASVRDKRLDSSESARYVSPGVIGYQDLDANGHWVTVAPYGPVWVPNTVPVGWAPYRYGHWAWIAPWGWTWIDDAAWGFAPFHYGRWVYTAGYWGWAPGPYRYWSPCYAPALVGWVGGPGWGVGVGFGGAGWGVGINFGWFPLGWGEPYYPWYHGWHGRGLSPTYIRNVNVTNTYVNNITNITNNYYGGHYANATYVNRNVNGAVTAASASTIAGGRPINQYGTTVSRSQLMHAPMVRGVDANPTREGMLGGQAPRNNAVPPSGSFNRSVVTRSTPPAAVTQARMDAPRPGAGPSSAAMQPGNTVARPEPATIHAGNTTPQPGSTTTQAGNTAGRSGLAPTSSAENMDRAQRANGWSVHRPPMASGANGAPTSAAIHNVPQPPTQNASGYNGTHGVPAISGNSNAVRPVEAQRVVHQPPSATQAQRGQPMTPPSASSHVARPSDRPSAPAHQSAPSHNTKPESKASKASPAMASAVPRPPSNYTYHAAPAYQASSYTGSTGSAASSYGRSAGYSVTPSYGARGSYSAAPSYGSSVGHAATYGSPQTYSAQRGTPYIPHSAAPAAAAGGGAHYSAPAGGGAHYSAPSGGGHASGGSSHSSGGSHSR